MPTKRQIENAHMRGAYLALHYTGRMSWRQIEAIFGNIPYSTMQHNMTRAKRLCEKDGISEPTLRQLLLHAEETPRGGAEARQIYPVGSAVSEKLKELALRYEGQKDVPLKRIVAETAEATDTTLALSTAARILRDHHGIQRRGPTKGKYRKKDKTGTAAESSEGANGDMAGQEQMQDDSEGANDDGPATGRETANGDMRADGHQTTTQHSAVDEYQATNHIAVARLDTSTDPNIPARGCSGAMQNTDPRDGSVQHNRGFQFAPSSQYPLYDLSTMRNPYQPQVNNAHPHPHHDGSFANYLDPSLNPDHGQHEVT